MELFVDSPEGVSLTHEDGGQTFFSYFSKENSLGSYISDFKSLVGKKYTRILVGKGKENVYPLTFSTYDTYDSERNINTTIEMRVHRNNDGSVSLSCERNKKFMTWGDGEKIAQLFLENKLLCLQTLEDPFQVALRTCWAGY